MMKIYIFQVQPWSSRLKPSPYFADSFRYFFKRFRSREFLLRWFIKKAGPVTEPFEYPIKVSNLNGILIILPERSDDLLSYAELLRSLESQKIKGLSILSNKRHEKLLETLKIQSEVLYYTALGCRYGEPEFRKLEQAVCERHPSLCLYLEPKPIFQLLYLAKVSGAAYRLGFDSEKYYPLLNLSLVAGEDSLQQAKSLAKIFNGERA